MKSTPILSIVMPVFNKSALVIEMLHCIRSNTFQSWELLMIDDGSNESEYMEVYDNVKDDNRIRLLRRSIFPKGAQTCRNIGLSLALGKYVCFFDSDDRISRSCLQQRVDEMEKHPEVDFMVFRSYVVEHGVEKRDSLQNIYGYAIFTDDLKSFCRRELPFVVWNNIYRRESLLKYNITWDIHLKSLQDAEFNMQTLLSGMKYIYSDKPADYGYRIDTVSSVSKKVLSEEHYKSNLYAVERFYKNVQGKYGHKYDFSLYYGTLFVYTSVVRAGYSAAFVGELAKVIRRYSCVWGILFMIQAFLTKILSYFLSKNIARRIPMLPYLYYFRQFERVGRPRKIQRLWAVMLFLLCFVAFPSCGQSVSGRDSSYELMWQDNFNKSQLDTTKWTKIKRWSEVRSFRYLTDNDCLLKMKGGKLRMYALHNNNVLPKDTATYLTAGITSEKKATFTYGKVVVRARVHGAIGSWPAVWIMPEDRKLWDQKSLKYSEIDLLEYVNQNDFVYQTAHNAYTLAAKENRHNPEQQNLSKIKKDSYNIYSVEILPNVLIFGVNDKEMFRYPCVSENKKFFNYGVESHIIINTQVDPPKGWNKGMQTNSFPAYIDIDWIKVYKLKQ